MTKTLFQDQEELVLMLLKGQERSETDRVLPSVNFCQKTLGRLRTQGLIGTHQVQLTPKGHEKGKRLLHSYAGHHPLF